MGYTFAGTTIQLYDDNDVTGGHTAGLPHSAAEMAASTDPNVAANWVLLAGNVPKYRSLMNVRLGSNVASNPTTWTDTDAVFDWDNTRTLSIGNLGTSSSTINWGTKIGTGNKATGRNGITAYFGNATNLRCNLNLYGCHLVQVPAGSGAFQFVPVSGSNVEMIDCIVGHKGTGATAQIAIGSAVQAVNNVYNVDFWGNTTNASAGVLSQLNCTVAERITIGGNANFYCLRTAQATIAVKDILFFGSPGTADIVSVGGATTVWSLVRPGWSGNAPKFGPMTAAVGTIQEYWTADVKVVDGNGTGVSGISVRLTDSVGNVQIDTTTDSVGRISFGSGVTTNAVSVMDHYGTAANYLTRARSPFLAEFNTVNTNTGYAIVRFLFDWPTDANGNFEDVALAVPLRPPGGGPSSWVEFELGVWPPV